MIRRLRGIFRAHPWLSGGFFLALAVTLYFTIRALLFMAYWADPAHRFQTPEPWMTPRYIARSWAVPPEALFDVLGMNGPPEKRITLGKIAAANGLTMGELAAGIESAAEVHRQNDRRRSP